MRRWPKWWKGQPISCLLSPLTLESPAAKPSTQLTSKRLQLRPSQFSSRKGPAYRPRMTFCNGTTTQSTFPPQSGTFNGGKVSSWSASLPFCQTPPQLTFFCFREIKSKLADLSLSQGSLMMNLEGVIRTSSKNEFVIAFWQWMDCCKQYAWMGSEIKKKSSNSRVFTMIHIEVSSPCVFDSEHTSYITFYCGLAGQPFD